MPDQEPPAADEAPYIRFLSIRRFRGIEKLLWRPGKGVNVLLGGGDVGKTTILEAIALLLNPTNARSEEHTSELQSLMRISYAVFCLQKKKTHKKRTTTEN